MPETGGDMRMFTAHLLGMRKPGWKWIPRALLHGLTFALLLLAVAGGVVRWQLGRVFALSAGHLVGLESLVPGSTATANASAYGVRGINPYVRLSGAFVQTAEGMQLSAAVAGVELDTFRSIVHFAPILKRMELRNAGVDVSQAADGHWRVPAATAGGHGRARSWLQTLVWESARLELADARLRLRPAQGNAVAVRMVGSLQNVGGVHRGSVQLTCPGVCGGELRYNINAPRVLGKQDGALTFSLRGVPRINGALRVGDFWLDVGDTQAGNNTASGFYAVRGGHTWLQGQFAVAAQLRNSAGVLNAVLTSKFVGNGKRDLDIQFTDLGLRLNDVLVPLTGTKVAQRDEGWFGVLPDTAIQAVIAPVAAAHVLPAQATQWLTHLNPRAVLLNPRLFLGKELGKDLGNELAYAATLQGIALEGYLGAPEIKSATADVVGYGNGGRFTMQPARMRLGFPVIYDNAFDGITVTGPVDFWIGNGGFVLHSGLLGVNAGDVQVAGRFALQMPHDPVLQTLTLMLEASNGRSEATPRYLPRVLPPKLREWLVQAIGEGHVATGFVGVHAYLHPSTGQKAEVELTFDVDHTAFRFQPDWPRLEGIVGNMSLSNDRLVVDVRGGNSGSVRVSTGRLTMEPHDQHLALAVRGVANPSGVTDFLLHAPVGKHLGWLADWQGSGDFGFDLNGSIALANDAHTVTVTARPSGTAIHNDKLRVALTDLVGSVRYVYPQRIEAKGVRGSLHQRPVAIDITSTDSEIRFAGRGRGDGAWLAHWLPWPLEKATAGSFAYGATMTVHTGIGHTSSGGAAAAAALPAMTIPAAVLDVRSDLQGFAVNLPAPLIKTGETLRPVHFHLEALDDVTALRLDDAVFGFRGELRNGELGRGVVAVSAPMPALPEHGLQVLGAADAVDVLGWGGVIASGGGAVGLPLTVNLDVARLLLASQVLPKANLRVVTRGDGWRVDVDQQYLQGNLQIFHNRRPMSLALSRLRLPRPPQPTGAMARLITPQNGPEPPDPLLGWQIKQFPPMTVEVDQLNYGDEALGKVSFDLQPVADGIELQRLTGALRNVAFRGARLAWQRDARGDRTRFSGALSGKDLATVLESFGFAGSVRSSAIALDADVGWPGSPANFKLRGMEGTAHINLRSGQFVQVQGANTARALGIFDFASIARRARLDFSDVFGKGLSYDKIDADLRFSGGVLSFPKTLRVEGPGSAFRMGGTVNLATGALDNDMIVTLPLSRTLPWYAAYAVLTANPLAGAGVLVAEQLLGDRLDRFSSAKYHVAGTVDEPQVKFVAVFNNQVDQPRRRAAPASAPPAGAAPHADPAVAPAVRGSEFSSSTEFSNSTELSNKSIVRSGTNE